MRLAILLLFLLIEGQQPAMRNNPEVSHVAAESADTWKHSPLDWKVEEQQFHRVLDLIAEGKVQTGPDYLSAENVIERRFLPDDQLLAHVLALDSLARGDMDARWQTAETLDHFLVSVGSRPVFGTQYVWPDVTGVKPRERVAVEPSIVSDPLRKLLCVAPLSGPGSSPETLAKGIEISSLAIEDCPAKLGSVDSKEAAALYEEDQDDRQAEKIDWKTVPARDQHRREQATQLLISGRLTTGNDFYHLAMLWQHGSTPAEYLRAHILATVAIAYGSKDARWLAAATLDRYLRSVWRPQIFGTQFIQQPWETKFSLAPMNRDLISDPAKAALCVVPMKDRGPSEGMQNGSALENCK